MQVTIDSGSGFCFGVTTAIKKAEEELQKGVLYCLGDIVHNGQEVQRLADMGLETIDYDDLRTLHNARVLLRAHGEPPSTYHIAQQNDIQIIDASCPVVLRLQKKIRDTYRHIRETGSQAQIVIFGQRGHAEVIGLEGQTNNTAVVIEQLEEAEKIDFQRDIYLFSQTTKSVEGFRNLVNYIQNRCSESIQFQWYDTICRNVANRVEKLKAFAQEQDRVIFVGGKKSSNAKVLFQHCQEANPRTVFVSSEKELTNDILADCQKVDKVGICGATSTPLWLMEKCKEKLLNL